MLTKKQKYLFWGLFTLIFISILLVATFYDLQISQLLAGKDLINGNFYSVNKFARFFEVVGEMPLYLFVMFACAILIVNFFNLKNKVLSRILQALFFVIGVGVAVYGFMHFVGYLADFHPETFKEIEESKLSILIYLVIDAALQFLLTFLIFAKFKNNIKELTIIAVIILITAALSNGIVQGIKPFAARERFRAFYYFEYRNVAHQGFTNWYIFNGSAKEIAATYPEELNVTKSFYTSFPSGHTCGAAITYTMMFFPVFIDKLNKKKTSWIFIAIPVVYTGIVAFTRILIGAHYLSDVLFGGTITFISAIIAYYIVKKFIDKKA